MMDRKTFTEKIAKLLVQMNEEGESPILDFAKRSAEEQNRLFKAGLSKCDGYKNPSRHQRGTAVDLYFCPASKLEDPIKGWDYWHTVWEEMGGNPIIAWDKGHFES